MKSYIRTIIVLGVIALLTVTSTLAQETPGETAPAGIENLSPTTTTPSPSKENEPVPLPPSGISVASPTAKKTAPAKASPPPPSPPRATSIIPVAGEVDVATSFALTEDSPRGVYSYVNVAPTAVSRSSSSSRKVLVIPNTEVKTEELVAITQDLQVMSHIFHKIFTGPRLIEGIFKDYGYFFGRGSRATEAVYLQGYGVLFLMEVNIPLSSPPKAKEQEKDENTQKPDSVWNQAKQEIFHTSPYPSTRAVDPTERYDAEKVEELKSRLIKALKHAANMKNLEPNELIILTVIGKGSSYSGDPYSGGGYNISEYERGSAENAVRNYRRSRSPYSATRSTRGGTGSASSTVLTIRAKKSDVDAFAKGDLDYDKFREKVQVLTYPYFGSKIVRPTPSRIMR
jgi:hypothetical protein